MSLSKIIELLEQDNVRRAIQEDNLDTVYEEAIRKTMDLSELTDFFESRGIAPLDYVAAVYQFMYSHNEAVSIRLHDNIKVIDSDGFAYCKVLQNIVIPDSVTEIGSYAFRECESLTYVLLPKHVSRLGNCIFHRCSSLTKVRFNGTKKEFLNSIFMVNHMWLRDSFINQCICTDGIIDLQ